MVTIRQYWEGPLSPLGSVAGTAFNTFTTFQDIFISATTPAPKIGANGLEVGAQIRLTACGAFSNTGTPTLSVGFYWGTAATVLAQSVAATTITAATAWPWMMEYEGRVRAIGTSGSIYGQGQLLLPASISQFQAAYAMPITAAARTVTIDTTVEKVVGVGAAWSASSASNTITVEKFTVELIS